MPAERSGLELEGNNENRAKILAEWFNNLAYLKQRDIIDYMGDNIDDFLEINTDEQKLFEELVDVVKNLTINEMDRGDKIIETLLGYGFEKITANCLLNFCRGVAAPYIDSKIINSMNPAQLEAVIEFIINNVVLYENYKHMPFKVFMKTGNFENRETAQRVLRFIKRIIDNVCNRDLSPQVLEQELINEYNIEKELNDIIIDNINHSLGDMQQAYLLTKVNRLLLKLSNLSCSYDI
jgi:hypothetical protein